MLQMVYHRVHVLDDILIVRTRTVRITFKKKDCLGSELVLSS